MTCCNSCDSKKKSSSDEMDWGPQGFKIMKDDTFMVSADSEFAGWKDGYKQGCGCGECVWGGAARGGQGCSRSGVVSIRSDVLAIGHHLGDGASALASLADWVVGTWMADSGEFAQLAGGLGHAGLYPRLNDRSEWGWFMWDVEDPCEKLRRQVEDLCGGASTIMPDRERLCERAKAEYAKCRKAHSIVGGNGGADGPVRRPPPQKGLSTCLRWGERLKEIAEESVDYADFVDAMGVLADSAEAHPRNPATDGFNAVGLLNSEHNMAHYASAMYYGTALAAGQAVIRDIPEIFTDPENHMEHVGEVYADISSIFAVLELTHCLQVSSAWYKVSAFDDDAWKQCRHIVWESWIDIFCEKWS